VVEGPDLLREAGVMPSPRKYTDEMRERAVRMVEEALQESPGLAHKRACQQVGDQLGIPGATLRNWFRSPYRPSSTAGAGEEASSRIAQLEKENRELRRANAILKSASAFFAAELDRPSSR
jgi:transposase